MRFSAASIGLLLAVACTDATSPTANRLAIAPPSSVSRDLDLNETEPSALATVNPCNNDAVALTGTTHILLHSTEARSGNFTYFVDFTSSYSGMGIPSLVKYQGTNHSRSSFKTTDPFPIVQDFYFEDTLRAATSVLNYTLRIHLKVTINATGVPTAEIVDYTTKCGG